MKNKYYILVLLMCIFISAFSPNEITIKTKIFQNGDINQSESQISETENRLKIKCDFTTMIIGENKKINTLYDEHVTENVVYSSEDENVIEIDNEGNLTARNKGKTVIKASYLNYEDSIEIEVVENNNLENDVNIDNNRTLNKNILQNIQKNPSPQENINISYSTHVQDYGWQDYVSDGDLSGTTNQAKRLEAIIIKLSSEDLNQYLLYRTHIENIGWEVDYKTGGMLSGTTNQAKRLEAIQIKLVDELAQNYNIYYRVHAQNFGWLGWAKNGEMAGTAGFAYRLEAIEIKVLPKTDTSLENSSEPFYGVKVEYQSHISYIGWEEAKNNGQTSGIENHDKIEGIKIQLQNQDFNGNIEYMTYIEDRGWEDNYKINGELSGTVGQSKGIEAIKMNLTGEMANHFDIYYRIFAKDFGWLGWTKNGEYSGTIGYKTGIEAIQISVVKKGKKDGEMSTAFYENLINYRSHIGTIGWEETKTDGEISGTVGQNKQIEGIEIHLNPSQYSGDIIYKTYIEDKGWENDYSVNGQLSGTTGVKKKIEAIQIKLTDELSDNFDVYYRTHVQNIGWLNWTKNGDYSGSQGLNFGIEAIQIKVIKKNTNFITDDEAEAFIISYNGYQLIVTKVDDNKVVEDYCNSKRDGSNVSIYDRNNSNAQIWKFNRQDDGYYLIMSANNPNVVLTSQNGNAILNRYTGSNNQKWQIKDLKDGYISLISKESNLYLNVENGQKYNTTNVNVSNRDNTDNQKFKLVLYDNKKIYNGIDVSSHNNVIDWDRVSASGVDFAIIRLGYGNNETNQDDTQFIQNIKACEERNIPYGVYIYSYALNLSEAEDEAQHVLRLLQSAEVKGNFKLGVWLDMEDADYYKARHGMPSNEMLVDICDVFAGTISRSGYQVGIYASLNWLNNQLNSSKLDKYQKWVAQWKFNDRIDYGNARNYTTSYSLSYYKLWQFCSDGIIEGISGNTDLNLGYDIFE